VTGAVPICFKSRIYICPMILDEILLRLRFA